MSTATASGELFSVCIEDLVAGRRQAAERLPQIARSAGSSLAAVIAGLGRAFADQAARMEELCGESEGMQNIWIKGILDDASRDTKTIAEGPLLDIALIGAVRKALVADCASLETASSLARSCNEESLVAEIYAIAGQVRDFDQMLRLKLYETVQAK